MTSPARLARACLWATTVAATATLAVADSVPTPAATPALGAPARPNPALMEVPLPAGDGWNATLVLDNAGVGIWTVEAFQVFPHSATPEIVGLDDLGRVQVCSGYSGKWTPTTVVSDGKWLGGLAHGDVDPRLPGEETYTGSQQGNLYQVVAWPHGVLDYRLIAHLPGREIHTIVAGDLDAGQPGQELIVFTRPGGLYRVTPTGPHGTFETRPLADYDGRVRQALVLPPAGPAESPSLLTASHNGRLERLQLGPEGPHWQTIHQEPMGLGRLALRPPAANQRTVLYSTLDDGRILRHEQRAHQDWATETIYLGPQGPRGIVAGPFGDTPDLETVAVFGYSRKVELLTRTAAGWRSEAIFEDADKGHWLAVAELDGRNATREILTSGYSGRIVLLTRPPGYGRPEHAIHTTAAARATLETFDALAPDHLPGGWMSAITGEGAPCWKIESDPASPSHSQVLTQSGTVPKPAFPLCLLESSSLRDGFVETRFHARGGAIDQAAGVVWRVRDAANYYVCRANALENNVVLYRVENGQRTPLEILGRTGGYGVDVPVPAQQWHTLRVDFTGSRFRASLNGHPLFEVEDATFAAAGRVGLWTKADSLTSFDDFRYGRAE